MIPFLKSISEKLFGKSAKGNPQTTDNEFVQNYIRANRRGSEDDLLMLNMMTGGKPILSSTTEPREYRAPGDYCTESMFARDCLGAEMMGACDAEVGRPIPKMASTSYRRAYTAKQESMTAGTA